MQMKKITKLFLMLIAAVAIGLGMTGCGNSLSDDEVIAKIQQLALNESSQMGYGVKVRRIHGHVGKAGLIFHGIFSDDPSCDELWSAEFYSDKWKSCMVRLLRRGTNYYLHFNPQDI